MIYLAVILGKIIENMCVGICEESWFGDLGQLGSKVGLDWARPTQ